MKYLSQTLITLLLIISSLSVYSQNDFREGYIITNSNDTIVGKLSFRGDKTLSKKCYFKKEGEIKEYNPFDITGFRFKESRFFISRKIEDKSFFLEVLIKGKLSMYYYMDSNYTQRYFVENEDGVFKELTYNESEVVKNGSNYSKQSVDHVGILSYFTAKVPSLRSSIETIKQPNAKSLIKIGEKYHNAVCDYECIVYKTKSRESTILLEFVSGIKSNTDIEVNEYIVTKKAFTYGILANFLISSLGDRWYLKTGFLNNKLERYTDSGKTIIRGGSLSGFTVPIYLEYIDSKGAIRPKISYGPAINSSSVNLGLGANIILTKSLFISLNSEFNFHSVLFLIPTDGLSSVRFYGGLGYKL